MFNRYLLAFLVSLLSVTSLAGCGAGLGAFAAIAMVVSEALSILQGIDRVVQEFFLRHPETSVSTRMEYLRLSQSVQDALLVLQEAAKGSESLSEGDAATAFAAFQQAYEKLMHWLQTNGLRDQQSGALMLDGHVISEPLPSAALIAEKATR